MRAFWKSFTWAPPGSPLLAQSLSAISQTGTVNCFTPVFENWANPGRFFCPAAWHYLCNLLSNISQKKKKKKGEAFPFSCLCFWLKCQYFLLASFLITRNCGRWKTKKRNISICLPIDKQFLLCGEVLPTAILTPAPLRAQCSASVCRGAQPHLRQLLLKPTWKTSTVNSSFLLRTAAILYGDIKRLKDPGQLRLITSLEKQITPFSADPLLLARPAISKLWKKEKEREREASDSRAEPKVTSNAARIWNLRGKKE